MPTELHPSAHPKVQLCNRNTQR